MFFFCLNFKIDNDGEENIQTDVQIDEKKVEQEIREEKIEKNFEKITEKNVAKNVEKNAKKDTEKELKKDFRLDERTAQPSRVLLNLIEQSILAKYPSYSILNIYLFGSRLYGCYREGLIYSNIK